MAAHRGLDGEEIAAMWVKGIPTKEIAATVGCSMVNVRKRALAMGLTPRSGLQGKGYWTQEPTEPEPGRTAPKSMIKIDRDKFRAMWADGLSGRAIARELGCSDTYAYELALAMELPKRNLRSVSKIPRVKKPAPTTHIAAVKMPDAALQARKDWPDIEARIMRAKGKPAPQATLATIAAAYRLPVAMVQGAAGRLWG